jgi:hypothetical protein
MAAAEEPEAVDSPPSGEGAPTGPAAAARARSTLRTDGMERPVFVLDFPDDPELERLVAAFEAGDYAQVRAEAAGLAARTESPAVREAALELRRRIEPDPLARYLLVISALLLVFLTVWAYGVQSH